jgi:hypothetical protein
MIGMNIKKTLLPIQNLQNVVNVVNTTKKALVNTR